MLFKIVFFLLFLFGVSLFISTVATLILKKRSKRVVKSGIKKGKKVEREKKDLNIEASKKSMEYHKNYLDRVSEVRRSLPQERIIPQERANEPGIYAHPNNKKMDYRRVKWIMITIVVAGILFSGTLLLVRFYKINSTIPKLYLCEGVDFVRLKPIKSSDRFTRGNVTVFFKSKQPIKQKYLTLEIYKLGEAGFIPYAKKRIEIKPEWTSFVATVLFDQLGNYIVEVKGPDDKLIAQHLVEIVPDNYAYKAKPRLTP